MLVILDRDGVINEDSDNYIKSLAEWQPIQGSIEAIAQLSRAGFTVAVATNQSGLARGLFELEDLEAMHQRLSQLVIEAGGELGGIFYCGHHPDDGCDCRKPRTGLLQAIERELGESTRGAWFIGDSMGDLDAATASGSVPILVRTGKGERTLAQLRAAEDPRLETLRIFPDLAAAAVALIVEQGGAGR